MVWCVVFTGEYILCAGGSVLHRYGVNVVLQPSVEVHNGPITTGYHMLVSGPDFIVCCVSLLLLSHRAVMHTEDRVWTQDEWHMLCYLPDTSFLCLLLHHIWLSITQHWST